jgi:hypothetical protein
MSKIIVGLYGSLLTQDGTRIGNARCGKDTFADEMIAANPQWKKYSLSSPIKHIINNLFDWNEVHSDGYLKEIPVTVNLSKNWAAELSIELNEWFGVVAVEATPPMNPDFLLAHFCEVFGMSVDQEHITISPRQAYQWFGTEFGRAISDTIWLDLIPTYTPFLIITDVRFPNEMNWGVDNDCFMLGIDRTEDGESAVEVAAHASEQSLDRNLLTASISNNGTLEEFKDCAADFQDYLMISTFGETSQNLEGFQFTPDVQVGIRNKLIVQDVLLEDEMTADQLAGNVFVKGCGVDFD